MPQNPIVRCRPLILDLITWLFTVSGIMCPRLSWFCSQGTHSTLTKLKKSEWPSKTSYIPDSCTGRSPNLGFQSWESASRHSATCHTRAFPPCLEPSPASRSRFPQPRAALFHPGLCLPRAGLYHLGHSTTESVLHGLG